MDTETWRAVAEYEACYEVSNRGRVRRIEGVARSPRGVRRLRRVPAKDLRPALVRGYETVNLCRDGKPHAFKIHRLVARAFIGPRPAGLHINHKDGNKRNNTPENLEYISIAANNQHAYDVCGKGAKIRRGEENTSAKLTNADVHSIRALRANGVYLEQLAAQFGVTSLTITHICKRKTWKHLP